MSIYGSSVERRACERLLDYREQLISPDLVIVLVRCCHQEIALSTLVMQLPIGHCLMVLASDDEQGGYYSSPIGTCLGIQQRSTT